MIGERHRIQPLAIAGADPHPAETPEQALSAWAEIGSDVAVLILTGDAAAALAGRIDERRDLLVTVMR